MKITKNTTFIFVGGAILLVAYVLRPTIASMMESVNAQPKASPFPAKAPVAVPARTVTPPATPPPQTIAAPVIAPPAVPPPPVAAPNPPITQPDSQSVPPTAVPELNTASVPPRMSGLNGIWGGRLALANRGNCNLRFEFHDDFSAPNQYKGFFQLWCGNNIDRANPEAATLTGEGKEGTIEFKLATLIGTDSHGCAPSTLTVIPFGAGQIVGKWTETACPGGHVVMQRSR